MADTLPDQTRRKSWKETQANLGPRQLAVLSLIQAIPGGLTAWEIAERMGLDVYVVRPRVSELKDLGLIKPVDVRWHPKTARHEALWVAVLDGPAHQLSFA